MDEKNNDEYLLETIAKTTGNDELLRKYRQNPHSTLDIVKTAQGGFEIRLVKPTETFWSTMLMLLFFGVGVFSLVGWGVFFIYELTFGSVPNGLILFMIRSVLFGVYVCIKIWNEKNTWNHLTRGYRGILVGLMLAVLVGGLTIDILNGDTWGLAWSFTITGLAVKALFESESE